MKLQRQLAYTYKGKRQYKNVIVVPGDVVFKLGWKKGEELEGKVEGSKLILKMKR